MAVQLASLTLEAARLWRDHPPRIHHPKKHALLALAGGLERTPMGSLVVSRWSPTEIDSIGPGIPTTSAEGPFDYRDPDADAWHVNFADPELFAFYGGPAFAQDEIQVAEHPLLASVREALLGGTHNEKMAALTWQGGRPTPVLVRNVERWSAINTNPELAAPHGIYGRKLSMASDDALKQAVTRLDGSFSNILAIAAPQGMGRYSVEQIQDIITTATTGFLAARAESPTRSAPIRIHTGHWGTGAFGGHRVLMAAAQLIAARIARVELVYWSLDDDGVRSLERGRAIADAIPEGASFGDAVGVLDARGFVWGASDGN